MNQYFKLVLWAHVVAFLFHEIGQLHVFVPPHPAIRFTFASLAPTLRHLVTKDGTGANDTSDTSDTYVDVLVTAS